MGSGGGWCSECPLEIKVALDDGSSVAVTATNRVLYFNLRGWEMAGGVAVLHGTVMATIASTSLRLVVIKPRYFSTKYKPIYTVA